MMKFSSKIEKKSTAGSQVSGDKNYDSFVKMSNLIKILSLLFTNYD